MPGAIMVVRAEEYSCAVCMCMCVTAMHIRYSWNEMDRGQECCQMPYRHRTTLYKQKLSGLKCQ